MSVPCEPNFLFPFAPSAWPPVVSGTVVSICTVFLFQHLGALGRNYALQLVYNTHINCKTCRRKQHEWRGTKKRKGPSPCNFLSETGSTAAAFCFSSAFLLSSTTDIGVKAVIAAEVHGTGIRRYTLRAVHPCGVRLMYFVHTSNDRAGRPRAFFSSKILCRPSGSKEAPIQRAALKASCPESKINS